MPPIPQPPKPTRIFFDPYNSSSTGHQRADSKIAGSTSWRDSRTYKLANQFGDTTGRGGDAHLSDLVGAGSETWGKEGRKQNGGWEKNAPGLREHGWQDISKLMNGSRKRKSSDDDNDYRIDEMKEKGTATNKRSRYTSPKEEDPDKATATKSTPTPTPTPTSTSTSTSLHPPVEEATPPSPPPQIFTSLTLHLNGSTLPLISDYCLKTLFAQHGGSISLSLARRKVTHVILSASSTHGGSGGGLASSKIQREIARVGGKGVKYVTAQWVVDSVERGRRLAEVGYVPMGVGRIGGAGQKAVGGLRGTGWVKMEGKGSETK